MRLLVAFAAVALALPVSAQDCGATLDAAFALVEEMKAMKIEDVPKGDGMTEEQKVAALRHACRKEAMATHDNVMNTIDKITALAQSAAGVCTGADLTDATELLDWARELKTKLTPSDRAFRESCANYR